LSDPKKKRPESRDVVIRTPTGAMGDFIREIEKQQEEKRKQEEKNIRFENYKNSYRSIKIAAEKSPKGVWGLPYKLLRDFHPLYVEFSSFIDGDFPDILFLNDIFEVLVEKEKQELSRLCLLLESCIEKCVALEPEEFFKIQKIMEDLNIQRFDDIIYDGENLTTAAIHYLYQYEKYIKNC